MLTSALLVFGAGLLLGSLLNVLIIRLPRERRLVGWPHCTRSGERLAWWQLLPVAGWLIQRGRAPDGRRLHWIFPLVELLTAVTLVLLHQRYGLTAAFWYLGFVCTVLIVTGAIDWLHRFIYTFVILGAALLALVIGPIAGMNLPSVLLGALVAGASFIAFYLLARMLFPGHAAPFGLGDVYLGVFIGAAVGLGHLASALFYGMLMAGIVALVIVFGRHLFKRDMPTYISYGSYLCLGVIVYVVTQGI